MEKQQKESIIKDIVKIAENLQDPFTRGNRRSRFVSRDGIAYSLTDEYLDLWDDILKELLIKHNWNMKFSEKYVDSKLQEIINNLTNDKYPQRVHEYFDQLENEYEQYSKEQVIYIPLFGIELDEALIELGNITLEKLSDKRTDELIERLCRVILSSSNTDEEKKMHFDHEKKLIDEYLRNRVCAVIALTAEPDRALEIAETETQRTLDLLRYAIPAIYSPDKKVIIGLQGKYSRQIRYAQIFSADGESFSCRIASVGPLFPLELSIQNLKHMKKIGVFVLGDILKKEKASKFEETLLQGIEWFSRAQIQSEPKNKLLNLMTVLETFLTPNGNDPIQKTIAEGTAILLKDDPISRKKLIRRIKVFYGLRSKLSHGQGKEILDADVRELLNITGSLIMILTEQKDHFASKEELRNWIEYKKLGGLPEEWDKYKESLGIRG
jgi:hypothetical protein